jgi:general secretion pathway protein I
MQVLKIDAASRFHPRPLLVFHHFKTKGTAPGSNRLIQHPGFTLLEVMIALAVMSIVLVSVYRMHSQTLAMNAAARFYTQAPLLAQSKLAEVEAAASTMSGGDSGDFGENFPGYQWTVALDDFFSETLGEVARDLKRIDVTISLNDNEYIYNVRTYRFIRD